jgi:mannosyltransferase OCH1-like enzyme
MIPKLLHYVWVGGKPLPSEALERIETWRAHNPDYEMMLWNEQNIDLTLPYLKRAYAHRNWANVSNLVRLLALHEHGGVYLDIDIEARRGFAPLMRHEAFCGFQLEEKNPDWVNNAVLGAVPRHPFVTQAIRSLVRTYDGVEEANLSGPQLMTRLLVRKGLSRYADEGARVDGVFVAPRRYFYPYSWGEEFAESCVTPDTYTVHFWARSWHGGATQSLRQKLLRRLRETRYRAKDAANLLLRRA